MTREEEIRQAAYQYGILHAKNEIYQEDPSFMAGAKWADAHPTIFNHCVNEQSPDYLAGYEQGKKDANPEIAALEYEIERLKSKVQAADDFNTLLTVELEKAKSPWISVEDRLPEEALVIARYGDILAFSSYMLGKWTVVCSVMGHPSIYSTPTHWMPIPEISTTK